MFLLVIMRVLKILSKCLFFNQKGDLVAIVGSSGAGKSTIADLIPRFYEIDKGSIEIDGFDIKDLSINSLRKLMGIVNQEVNLFDNTIEFNVSYGTVNYTQNDLIKAKAANAYDFIMKNDGFQTIVGEKGVKLSGGQK